MKKSTLYCLLAALCLWANMNAMPQGNIKPLKVGDDVPGIVLTNIRNYPKPVARLRDFKGKLVILDFWSTWCGACIDAMPHMQQLQKQFGGKLQVILVNAYTADNSQRVTACLEKRRQRTGFILTLPYSFQQTQLASYFPHRFVPHYVWIGPNGKVIAVTSSTEVTAQNISAVLEGNPLRLHTKNDLVEFDANQPLFVAGNGGEGSDFSYRSILAGYQEGIGTRSGLEKNDSGGITRYYMLNYPALALLRAAYPEVLVYPRQRIVFDKADPLVFGEDAAAGTRRYSNSYCYELILPSCTEAERQNYMQEDLRRVFGVAVKTEKRMLDCLVLRAPQGSLLFRSGGGEPVHRFEEGDSLHITRNMSFSQFTGDIANQDCLRNMPLIDETGIEYPVDIDYPAAFATLSQLQGFLEKTGIQAIIQPRELEVSVIYNTRQSWSNK